MFWLRNKKTNFLVYLTKVQVKHSNILNTLLFLFSNKMLVVKAGNHKMLFRMANREDPGLDLHCLSSLAFQILEYLP